MFESLRPDHYEALSAAPLVSPSVLNLNRTSLFDSGEISCYSKQCAGCPSQPAFFFSIAKLKIIILTAQEIISNIVDLYKHDLRPWGVGYSGGKDSIMLASLIFTAAEQIPTEKRNKEIVIGVRSCIKVNVIKWINWFYPIGSNSVADDRSLCLKPRNSFRYLA